MRLTGKYNLHGLQRMQKQAFQTIQVVKNKVGPFVAGESSRKTYGKNLWIEQGSEGDDALRANAFALPLVARALVDVLNQQGFEPLSQPPEVFVRDIVNGLACFG